jgi:crossover junction endodeoxyribonuclease RusA
MPPRSRAAVQQGGRDGAQANATGSERPRSPDVVSQSTLAVSGPLSPRCWRLWFAARPSLPPALRPRTKTGKPKPPPPVLPPNVNERRRLHPIAERNLVAHWRGLAFTLARQAGIPSLGRIRVSVVARRRALGVADASGDAERLKPLIDGLVDAGVVPKDTYAYVEHGTVAEERAGTDGPGILLIVEEVGD